MHESSVSEQQTIIRNRLKFYSFFALQLSYTFRAKTMNKCEYIYLLRLTTAAIQYCSKLFAIRKTKTKIFISCCSYDIHQCTVRRTKISQSFLCEWRRVVAFTLTISVYDTTYLFLRLYIYVVHTYALLLLLVDDDALATSAAATQSYCYVSNTYTRVRTLALLFRSTTFCVADYRCVYVVRLRVYSSETETKANRLTKCVVSVYMCSSSPSYDILLLET